MKDAGEWVKDEIEWSYTSGPLAQGEKPETDLSVSKPFLAPDWRKFIRAVQADALRHAAHMVRLIAERTTAVRLEDHAAKLEEDKS